MDLVIGIILIVAAVFLIIAVLLQHGKDHNLSGTIAGASESFFGKSKSTTVDKKLSVITSVVAVIFVILVLVLYLAQGVDRTNNNNAAPSTTEEAVVTEPGTGTEPATEPTTEPATEAATEPATEAVTESAAVGTGD